MVSTSTTMALKVAYRKNTYRILKKRYRNAHCERSNEETGPFSGAAFWQWKSCHWACAVRALVWSARFLHDHISGTCPQPPNKMKELRSCQWAGQNTTNILFHPGGDYICASFARMLFPSKTMNDEFVSVIVNPVAGLDEWSRMESWFSYCKCLKQRWPVTALSWKQKDIQRLQTSNRYTITKQGVYQTSSRYHNIRYHFSDKGTYISVHEAIFWNDQG